jgi:flagellar protein FliO/FliZ
MQPARTTRAACAGLAGALTPLAAQAQTAAPAVAQALQVLAGLALVLVLIGLTAWGSRRLQAFKPHGRGRLRIVDALPLGTRERLLLVEVDGARVLLGVSAGRISALHAFGAGGGADFGATLAAARAPEAA